MGASRRQLVESVYEAFTRGAVDELRELLPPDFAHHPLPSSPEPQAREGIDAVVEFLRPDLFERQWTEPLAIAEHGDCLIAEIRTGGVTASGARFDRVLFNVWRFDGQVARESRLFADREDAERAAGLRS